MKNKIRFIDLFAGIGGMRLAFESVGAKCVFSSEWDKYCQETYKANFGEIPHGDITKIKEKDIPKFDVLLAGYNAISDITPATSCGIVATKTAL